MLESPSAEAPALAGSCANCGTPLVGEYCHNCGQRRFESDLSLKALMHDAVSNVTDLEHSKTLRTMGALLAQPGRLTNDYIAGRRANWITPLKLYVTIFAISLFMYSAFKSVAVYDVSTLAAIDRSGGFGKIIEHFATRSHLTMDAFMAEVNARWRTYASLSQILYPVLFAIALKLFYLRRRVVEHLIFSLHYQAVALLIVVLAWPLYFATGLALTQRSGILAVFITAVLIGYLVVAVRRVYGQSWTVGVLKGLALYAVYYAIYTTVTFSTLIAAMTATARGH